MELRPCAHCGGKAMLEYEGKHYIKALGKKVLFSRVICTNTKYRANESGKRCGIKTVAMPHPLAVEGWNRRQS